KAGVEGAALRVHAPLVRLSKAQIVREGLRLGVDFAETVSCYQADAEGRACRRCDACRLRAQGFADAGVADPTPYRQPCWRADLPLRSTVTKLRGPRSRPAGRRAVRMREIMPLVVASQR